MTTHATRGRLARALTIVGLCLLAAALPAATAGAHAPPNADGSAGPSRPFEHPRKGLEEVGFHPLLNAGFNTDVWAHTTNDGRLFAYSGTWGTAEGFADPGEACPSTDDDPLDPQQSGVKVVNATDPANPELAAKLASAPGAQNNDVKVADVEIANGFSGDLLAHSLEPCGAEGLAFQVFGPPFTSVPVAQTGFQLYDVTDPAKPRKAGTYNNGGIGTHNLYLYERPDLDRAFVAAVYNEAGLLTGVRGELQIVEVTDPDNPRLVSTFELADAQLPCEERGSDSAMCYLHDVWLSEDGNTAYLSYWDAGLVLLDVSNPEQPTLIGRAQEQVEGDGTGWLDEEGNTHAAVPYTLGDRDLVIVGDEDFTGGGSIQLKVNSPADLAGPRTATQWDGTAPANGQTASLAYAGTGCTSASYAGADVAGKIALVDKYESAGSTPDECPTFTFKQKMDAAEAAGAIGLVQIDNNDAASSGTALSAGIPGFEIANKDGVPIRDRVLAGDAVNVTMLRDTPVDPWGFVRIVDVTSANPADWRQIDTVKTEHTEDPNPGAENVFSAHNPIVGDDGRAYTAWYTDGLRVLGPDGKDGSFTEVARFVPRPEDHPDDLDSDPHGAQEDNVGFWGSFPICHPATGDRLVFNSDLNRGLYILRFTGERCSQKSR
jgi:hypothetical protein